MVKEKAETPLKHSENSDNQNYFEVMRQILEGEILSDKLMSPEVIWDSWKEYELPPMPGRKGRIIFSDAQVKFPKAHHLNEAQKKALALHSFANHELLAIEMMTAALLVYPHFNEEDQRFKKGVYLALKEEQKHFKLYVNRINELGFDFGDFPINDFFWKQMTKLKTPSEYLATMSLTFEAANLDFAQYYGKIFRDFGDVKTADILDEVLKDEIGHVAFGSHFLKKWRGDKTLWEYYLQLLPFPMTPARSRGISFDSALHLKAMNDSDFVDNLKNYEDTFRITKRSK